jgi:hypothetical protein
MTDDLLIGAVAVEQLLNIGFMKSQDYAGAV